MDLGELALDVADASLAQSIQDGLQKGLMTKPRWPSAAELEAKKGAVGVGVLKSELGQYVVNQWADATGSAADNFDEFRNSAQFVTLCKYLCLRDTTRQSPVTASLWEEQRPLGRGSFGAIFLVFKKDTGCAMATKKMMKTIIKDKGMIHDARIERVVLEKVSSRFLVSLLYAWQDKVWVGLVLTLCPGGDLGPAAHSTPRRAAPHATAPLRHRALPAVR